MLGKPHEECGVFGIYDEEGNDVVQETYLALYALQHRGQASCGIAVSDDGMISSCKDNGIITEVLTQKAMKELGSGKIAVGHVRYAAKGDTERANAQPLVMRYSKGTLCIAHNGALVNTAEIRKSLEEGGAIFQTTSDAELIAYLIAQERISTGTIEDAVQNAMSRLKGAYSLAIMSPHKLIAARDPNGFRPLCIGKMGKSFLVASESCAFDSIGAEFVRDVLPGEVVVCDEDGVRSLKAHCGGKGSFCVFEYVYFARPDSVLEGESVHMSRQKMGACLAKAHPVEADVVCGVPDSGLDAAIGYANESGIPYGLALIKNRYIGRTFIQDTDKKRRNAVKIKLNALAASVKGKRVVLVDDSIVRGTTCERIVRLLREAGAKEVHMRISSPPFLHPCYFGTDISSHDNLIACRMTLDEIRQEIGADSLGFLPIEYVSEIGKYCKIGLCDACFTGRYPIEIPPQQPKSKYEQKIRELEV